MLATPNGTDVCSEVRMLGDRALLPRLLPLLPSSAACEASLWQVEHLTVAQAPLQPMPRRQGRGVPYAFLKSCKTMGQKLPMELERKAENHQESNKQGAYLLLNPSPALRRPAGRANGLNTGVK